VSSSYDSNRNLTQKVEASTTWTYEWNAENQLTRVLSNGSEVTRYKYDPVGRRVEKVAGSVTTANGERCRGHPARNVGNDDLEVRPRPRH
jgi:YD repeat-containing protein